MLDKFKGINKEREITEREKATLEKLIELGRKFLKLDHKKGCLARDLWYVMGQEMHGIDFNELDLKQYILAEASTDYSYLDREVLGAYTGYLLKLLSDRTGKKKFHFNGQGTQFDYLFRGAPDRYDLILDEFVLEDFKGKFICCDMLAKRILLKNVEGKSVLYQPVRSVLNQSAKRMKVDMLIGVGITGEQFACYGGDESEIGLVIGSDMQGKGHFHNFGTKCKAEQIIVNNIEGDCTLENAFCRRSAIRCYTGASGQYTPPDQSSIELLFARNITGNNNLKDCARDAKVELMLFENFPDHEKVIVTVDNGQWGKHNDINADMTKAHWIQKQEDYKESTQLLDSLKNMTPEEIFKAAERIQEIYRGYKSVR